MQEKSKELFKMPRLASTSMFPRSFLAVGLYIEQINRGKSVTTFDYSQQSQNTFTYYSIFLKLEEAQEEFR